MSIYEIIQHLTKRLKHGKFSIALVAILFLSQSVFAQAKPGWNGAGFFDVYPTQVKDWLGGGYVLRYRADQKSGIPDDINLLIELSNYYKAKGEYFSIIYCAGLVETTPDENVQAISKLLTNRVEILSVELDNEPYNGKICDFDFECYKFLFEPHVSAIRANWPEMKISYFLAPRPKDAGVLGGSLKHAEFNNAVKQYLDERYNINDELSIHIYFNSRELSILSDSNLIVKRPYNPESYYNDLDYFYTNFFYEGFENIWLWDSTLNYLVNKFPGRQFNITEFGTDESGKYKNTIAYHALMSAVWNTYKHYPNIKTMLEHNGNAKAGAGCISPASEKYDYNPNQDTSLIRLALPTWKMQYSHPNKSNDLNQKISAPGAYQYHFVNMGALSATFSLNVDTALLQLSTGTMEYITGTNSYSSMGACPFMGPGTIRNYEITGTNIITFSSGNEINVPAWSYGYINVTYVEKTIPIDCHPKCKKPWFNFFHRKKCETCNNGQA